MEPSQNQSNRNEEVDLGQFFRSIGNGLNNSGRALLFFLASLRNIFFSNKLFFSGIIVIGISLGALYSELLKRKFYKSSMVLSCDYLNSQILQNTIDKLNLLCSEPQREGLSEVLKIDHKTALNIQRFAFESFVSEDDVVEMEVLRTQLNNVAADKKDLVEKVIHKLEIDNKNAYEILVQVYDPDVVKPLERAIITYFRENEYIKKRIEVNRKSLQKRQAKLSAESRKLDSLKSVLFETLRSQNKASRGSNNVIFNDELITKPLEMFREDLNINIELIEVEKDLSIEPDFEVVDSFTTFKEPESASLFRVLVFSFFCSIIIGYLIIGAWKFDAMLSKIDTKSK